MCANVILTWLIILIYSILSCLIINYRIWDTYLNTSYKTYFFLNIPINTLLYMKWIFFPKMMALVPRFGQKVNYVNQESRTRSQENRNKKHHKTRSVKRPKMASCGKWLILLHIRAFFYFWSVKLGSTRQKSQNTWWIQENVINCVCLRIERLQYRYII